MKNKKKSQERNVMLGFAIIFIALVCLIIILNYVDKFLGYNPEKDVCTSTRTNIQNLDRVSIDDLQARSDVIEVLIDKPNVLYTVCDWWRHKNKCEQNPEVEGCICDEYSNRTFIMCGGSNVCGIEGNYYAESARLNGHECNNSIIISCVKSHQRTLEDYNCTTLTKAVVLRQEYCNEKDYFKDNSWVGCKGGTEWNTTSEIYALAEQKGCLG